MKIKPGNGNLEQITIGEESKERIDSQYDSIEASLAKIQKNDPNYRLQNYPNYKAEESSEPKITKIGTSFRLESNSNDNDSDNTEESIVEKIIKAETKFRQQGKPNDITSLMEKIADIKEDHLKKQAELDRYY